MSLRGQRRSRTRPTVFHPANGPASGSPRSQCWVQAHLGVASGRRRRRRVPAGNRSGRRFTGQIEASSVALTGSSLRQRSSMLAERLRPVPRGQRVTAAPARYCWCALRDRDRWCRQRHRSLPTTSDHRKTGSSRSHRAGVPARALLPATRKWN